MNIKKIFKQAFGYKEYQPLTSTRIGKEQQLPLIKHQKSSKRLSPLKFDPISNVEQVEQMLFLIAIEEIKVSSYKRNKMFCKLFGKTSSAKIYLLNKDAQEVNKWINRNNLVISLKKL